MCQRHNFETIFTSNDVTNIQYETRKGFGSREISYSMVVNDYFGTRRTNRPHATPNYGPKKYNFEVYYYKQTYYSPEKLAYIHPPPPLEKTGQ